MPASNNFLNEQVPSFGSKLKAKWKEKKFVCVGLDKGDFDFNKNIIDQTHDLVCCYKPNSAFYWAEGVAGLKALEETVKYIHTNYPDVPVLIDAKIADIDNTNIAYAKAIFDWLKADAVTINPYPGKEAFSSFLERKDKGIFVWIKASSPLSAEFESLYQTVAANVAKDWNVGGNCGVVVGATYPQDLKKVREIVGNMPILIPGVGAQGGDVSQIVKAGLDSQGQGIIISSSRGIIFADNPRQATLDLHQKIQEALK